MSRMSQEIVVETVQTRLVAGLTFSTTMSTLPADMTNAMNNLARHISETGMTVTGPRIAVYADEMRADRPWKCEVCVPVAKPFGEHPVLRSHELPGGRVATVTHVGPYSDLKTTYDAVFAWFLEHGHTYAGPPREIYLNGPDEVDQE